MYLLEVTLPLPLFKTFHYLSSQYVSPGVRVVVPFGAQKLVGMVWDIKEASSETLDSERKYKEIEEILDPLPIYPQRFFPFIEWVSRYYLSPLWDSFKNCLTIGGF